MRSRHGFGAAVLAILVLALRPGSSAAFENEPDGFGPAKFGMPVEKVREVLPGLKEFAVDPKEPWALYAIDGQAFSNLKPCHLTLGFFGDKLYEVKFDCGRDDAVERALRNRFGRPTVEDGEMSIWRGEKSVVSMNHEAKTFAIADSARSGMLHQYLLQKALMREFAAQRKPEADPASSDQKPDDDQQ